MGNEGSHRRERRLVVGSGLTVRVSDTLVIVEGVITVVFEGVTIPDKELLPGENFAKRTNAVNQILSNLRVSEIKCSRT